MFMLILDIKKFVSYKQNRGTFKYLGHIKGTQKYPKISFKDDLYDLLR